MTSSNEITRFGLEITPELLDELRRELLEVFDYAVLERAHKRRVGLAGTREYAWVYRPEMPLLLQGFRDCDSWIAALRHKDRPPNDGALGPFVRLGLALRFGRRLTGGPERIDELKQLATSSDFDQLTNKAFEFEAAYSFARGARRTDIAFGVMGGKPDFWLAVGHPLQIPVECKVVSGGWRPSPDCLGEWRRLIVWAVKEMKRRKVCAGICVRAQDNFGTAADLLLRELVGGLLTDLAAAQDETWAVRSEENGRFLAYGYRLCSWGKSRPPFSVPLGLDGSLAVWLEHDTRANELRKPYFVGLKFQSPLFRIDATLDNFKAAADQLRETCPAGGVVALKVGALRMGHLFEIDREVRRSLASRDNVTAVLLLWDENAIVPEEGGAEGAKILGFGLKPYVIVNHAARVRCDWPDSKSVYFPDEPTSVLRGPSGELAPFDFEAEGEAVRKGSVLADPVGGSPWVVNAKGGQVPPFPHISKRGARLQRRRGE